MSEQIPKLFFYTNMMHILCGSALIPSFLAWSLYKHVPFDFKLGHVACICKLPSLVSVQLPLCACHGVCGVFTRVDWCLWWIVCGERSLHYACAVLLRVEDPSSGFVPTKSELSSSLMNLCLYPGGYVPTSGCLTLLLLLSLVLPV